jgi:hypothetical protein
MDIPVANLPVGGLAEVPVGGTDDDTRRGAAGDCDWYAFD